MLLRGLVIGFSIAAPVGPIGVLCIRRTLAHGSAVGLATGLGAATADALYGAVAGFGLTAVSGMLVAQQGWLRAAGGIFLFWLGVRAFLARPAAAAPSAAVRGAGLLGAYASTFVLTVTNPMTILSFAAVFAGFGVGAAGADHRAAVTLVVGVFAGSALWWLALSGAVALLRHRVTPRGLRWVNRASGALIAGFGVAALLSLAS